MTIDPGEYQIYKAWQDSTKQTITNKSELHALSFQETTYFKRGMK